MKPSILISGATGVTGSAAAKLLLERGFPVRAFVHGNDERSRELEALGAELFVSDTLDFRAVRQHLTASSAHTSSTRFDLA